MIEPLAQRPPRGPGSRPAPFRTDADRRATGVIHRGRPDGTRRPVRLALPPDSAHSQTGGSCERRAISVMAITKRRVESTRRELLVEDQRAAETADELVGALAERAAAVARLGTCVPGTRERVVAQIEVDYLTVLITDLERALAERPWTEA